MHIRQSEKHLLECKQLGHVFTASDREKKKRELAMYIKEYLSPKQIYAVEDGRLLMVEINRETKKMLIVNVYAPNSKQERFYQNLKEELQKYDYQEYCVIGDFNAVYDKKNRIGKQ